MRSSGHRRFGRHRQPNDEFAALARPFAQRVDAAAVQVDEAAHHVQADSEAAYFAGEANWNYFVAPFILARSDFVAKETGSWREDAQVWRSMRGTYPDTIVAQLQGGLIFGLTAALYGEVTVKNGRVQQSNFNDYRMLRIDQVPNIEVHIIKSGEDPGGIGEAGVTGGPPALRNAIYAATGVALRRLPIDRRALAAKA